MAEMQREPPCGQSCDFLESFRLGEKVGGTGNDGELFHSWKEVECLLVPLDDWIVQFSNQQQGGRLDMAGGGSRQIGAAAA